MLKCFFRKFINDLHSLQLFILQVFHNIGEEYGPTFSLGKEQVTTERLHGPKQLLLHIYDHLRNTVRLHLLGQHLPESLPNDMSPRLLLIGAEILRRRSRGWSLLWRGIRSRPRRRTIRSTRPADTTDRAEPLPTGDDRTEIQSSCGEGWWTRSPADGVGLSEWSRDWVEDGRYTMRCMDRDRIEAGALWSLKLPVCFAQPCLGPAFTVRKCR